MQNISSSVDLTTWIDQETAGSEFADERIGKRFRKLVEQLSKNVGQSIPSLCQNWASTKGAYRFLSNPRVSEADILKGHFQATAGRFSETQGPVLVLQDTTEFSFEREDYAAGKDQVGRFPLRTACGILMHSSLVVTTAGLPLGLAAVKFWTREKFKGRNALKRGPGATRLPKGEKESLRWVENMRQATELLGDPDRCVHTGDRENDIFEFFSATLEMGSHFLVRSRTDRLVGDEGARVSRVLEEGIVQGHHWIEVRSKEGQREMVMMAIKYRSMEIYPPGRVAAAGQSQAESPLILTVIRAEEVGTPQGREKIDWELLTDLRVNSPRSAIEKVQWYGGRWKIELFHKTMKSGCQVEESKLQTAQRLTNLLATSCILAWRIFWMTMLKRTEPQAPPSLALNEAEIAILDKMVKDKPQDRRRKKTLSDYILKIARLGGYLARANDPPLAQVYQTSA